jgi:hypothetical protein
MKKVILGILGAILVLGLFAGVGYAGYRIGFNQGAQFAADGNAPRFNRFDRDGLPRFMPYFDRSFSPRWFGMTPHNRGFGFFPPFFFLGFLGRIALIGLILWFVVWLFTRSGWRLSLTNTNQAAVNQPSAKNEAEIKEAGG